MHGSKRFEDAPDPIEVSCYHCKFTHPFSKQELKDKGVGKNAAMPDLIHGLARLLNCERKKASEHEQKSKPCMLKYMDLDN